jgi:predicted transglutaminase-like cysteine proteinase
MLKSSNLITVATLLSGMAAGGALIGGPASAEAVSSAMTLGAAAAPPRAFIDLCQRDATACAEGRSHQDIAEAQAQTQDAAKNYWLTRVRMVGDGPGAPAAGGSGGRIAVRTIARPTGTRNWRDRGYISPRRPTRTEMPISARIASPQASPPPPVHGPVVPVAALPPRGALTASYGPIKTLTWSGAFVAPAFATPTYAIADKLVALPALRDPNFLTAGRTVSGFSAPPVMGLDWSNLSMHYAKQDDLPREAPPPSSIAKPVVTESGTVARTGALWATVGQVNREVNRTIRNVSDIERFGREDVWQSAANGPVTAGDCEDFVIEKRRRLIAAGVPAAAMSIAIVKTPWRETHAVLLLATNDGDYVLDNLTPWIVRWADAGYEWDIRQAPGRPLEWFSIASLN